MSQSVQLVLELKLQLGGDESKPLEQEELSGRGANISPPHSCEKQNETTCEGELTGKKTEPTKTRYMKLKQKLASVCYKHEDVVMGKEATSSNKPRLMKLSIELDRQANSQVHNYSQMQDIVREIGKILEQRKDSDLHVLRQSKFIPSIMELSKRVLSSYKNQYKEAMRVLEPGRQPLTQPSRSFCCFAPSRQTGSI